MQLSQGYARFADLCANFLCALIAFLIALQRKCENLLGAKQPKFTEMSTPQGMDLTAHKTHAFHVHACT